MPSQPLFSLFVDTNSKPGTRSNVGSVATGCDPEEVPGLPGSTDVICGICATTARVRPHHCSALSTTDRAPNLLTGEQTGIGSALKTSLTFSSMRFEAKLWEIFRAFSRPAWCVCRFRGQSSLPACRPLAIVVNGYPCRMACSQGGVKFPTGGKGGSSPSPRAPSSARKRGQQIRCDSEADGHSPDERERSQRSRLFARGLSFRMP